jgi:carbamoylphosphate synthase small subunit
VIEAMENKKRKIYAVQFHPEGAPGPIDAARIFDVAVNDVTV